MKETSRRGRDRTAEVEVVPALTVLELREALTKLFWELIPVSTVLWKFSSKDKTQKTPFGVVGVAKALIAISGLLGETHPSSTGRVAFVASALRRDNETDHEIEPQSSGPGIDRIRFAQVSGRPRSRCACERMRCDRRQWWKRGGGG